MPRTLGCKAPLVGSNSNMMSVERYRLSIGFGHNVYSLRCDTSIAIQWTPNNHLSRSHE
jgi:hypothetical protein